MRQTTLRRGTEERRLRTDDRGTQLRDGQDFILAEHGNDRHEMLLDELLRQGWAAEDERALRPAKAGPMREPSTTPAGGSTTDGEDG